MALRLVDIYLPAEQEDLPTIDDTHPILDRRTVLMADDRKLVRVLLNVEDTEAFVEWLHTQFPGTNDYRIVMTAVAATIPHPEEKADEEEPSAAQSTHDASNDTSTSVSRLSREELYQDIDDEISVTKTHYMLVALSTIVAASGMLRDSVAIVIGAMVIAPLIGPNIALALGTTLADASLLRRALRVNLLGLLLGFALSVGFGLTLPVDPLTPEIASRTEVHLSDLALALAAGVAGTLSVTRGVSTALIGVMVAVALLPPLVAFGMLLGTGYWTAARGAGLLTLTNVVAINLAAVSTFLLQGIRPLSWYEAERAKRATYLALAIWLSLLAVLVTTILLAP